MTKLATPIIYEPSLDELNVVRPLKLAERSRLSLDFPVLSKNPVGTGRPIIGWFARCDEQGALLKNKSIGFSNCELVSFTFNSSHRTTLLIFSQQIFYLVMHIVFSGSVFYFRLTDSSYTKVVKEMITADNYLIHYVSWIAYCKAGGVGNWSVTLSAYGFY